MLNVLWKRVSGSRLYRRARIDNFHIIILSIHIFWAEGIMRPGFDSRPRHQFFGPRVLGDPGSIPGHATNFSGRGYWHTLVIQLLGGPKIDSRY